MINTLLELKELCSNIMEGVGNSGRTVKELFETLETGLQKEEKGEEGNDVGEGMENGNGDASRGTETAEVKRVSASTNRRQTSGIKKY